MTLIISIMLFIIGFMVGYILIKSYLTFLNTSEDIVNHLGNCIKDVNKINIQYKLIIDILEKQKCDNLTALNSNSEITNSLIKELSNIDTKIDKLYKFITNLQLVNNNKHEHICDKLSKIIINTNTVKECVELISNNTDKSMKSLEAKNSLCKCKSTKTSTKKKKEETQADNS